MHPRTFTVAQANALIPWLDSLFGETRKAVEELHLLRVSAARARMDAGGGTVQTEEADRMRELETQIRRHLEEATSLGIEVRRVDGLVDFPGWIDGQLVYLCWRYGEQEVTHYHPTSEGFTGRRPLPKQSPRELN
jgi:hypothetical protein